MSRAELVYEGRMVLIEKITLLTHPWERLLKMAKDHFIPASLIGRFSDETSGRLRDRKVWIASRFVESPRQSAAGGVGYENRSYDVDQGLFYGTNGKAVDNFWSKYEPQLPRVLDSLIKRELGASDWINVLVPFVAATFVRHRNYEERYNARPLSEFGREISEIRDEVTPDLRKTDINITRVADITVQMVSVISSEWSVIKFDDDIILPDIGFCVIPSNKVVNGAHFKKTVIPIDKHHAIMLVPRSPCPIAHKDNNGHWQIHVRYKEGTEREARFLNSILMRWGQDFVVGSEHTIKRLDWQQIGKKTPKEIDKALSDWPFNVPRKQIAGINVPIAKIFNDETVYLEKEYLDRYSGVRGLDPTIQVLDINLNTLFPADCFLCIEKDYLIIISHFSCMEETDYCQNADIQ